MEQMKVYAYIGEGDYHQSMVDDGAETEIGYVGHPGLHLSSEGTVFVSYWKDGMGWDVSFPPGEEPTYSVGIHDDSTNGEAEERHLNAARAIVNLFSQGLEEDLIIFLNKDGEPDEHGKGITEQLVGKLRQALES